MPPTPARQPRRAHVMGGCARAVLSATLALASPARARPPAHAGPSAHARPPAGLADRIERLIDRPPFDRATWAVLVIDSTGRVLYERNADRLMIPASDNKLLVSAAGMGLLGPSYRTQTSVYAAGNLAKGVLHGDLVVYGRGDPTYSAHCYGPDGCDSAWTAIDALADAVVAAGVKRVDGALVGDGSYFEPVLVHGAWEQYDLNWWYAAPVSGLGFNDNSVDIHWRPGARLDTAATVTFEPDFGTFTFDNRSRTTAAGSDRTLDFFRRPGTMAIWAEGTVPLDDAGLTEYFALPDPNLLFVQALRQSLTRRGVKIKGPDRSTTDSLLYREARRSPELVARSSRPVSDLIIPILNNSQNWFAEMLLKLVGRVRGRAGSWDEGLRVERRFLIDVAGLDSTSFDAVDGSGLGKDNLITPRALVTLLRYERRSPDAELFVRAMSRSGQTGSLRRRFVGTPLEGRVVAKTGGVNRVNSLSGYIEPKAGGAPLVFSVVVNSFAGASRPVSAQIDSVVVEMAR